MNKILVSTEFIPCPNGFFHPETYRLYEALESGCIPIVENALINTMTDYFLIIHL